MATVFDAILADPARYQLDGQWLPHDEIVRLLCTPRIVPNPTSQATIPRVPREADLATALEGISDSSMAKIVSMPIFEGFINAVKSGDRGATLRLIAACAKSGTITAEEYAGLMDVFAAEEPAPSWSPTVILPPACEVVSPAAVAEAIAQIEEDAR